LLYICNTFYIFYSLFRIGEGIKSILWSLIWLRYIISNCGKNNYHPDEKVCEVRMYVHGDEFYTLNSIHGICLIVSQNFLSLIFPNPSSRGTQRRRVRLDYFSTSAKDYSI
jgi:hypothetical protein